MPKVFCRIVFYTLCVCAALLPTWADQPLAKRQSSLESAPVDERAVSSDRGKQWRFHPFEFRIKQFEREDSINLPPKGATVFVGSSTFTKWIDLEKTFSEFKAINRGFGGSTLPDINYYASRIVTKYKPSKVVLYAGSNDIAMLHHSGEQVYEDFKEFVKHVHSQLPTCQIYWVSNCVAPSRLKWKADYEEGNSLIKSYIQSSSNLHYINVWPQMWNKDGQIKRDLYGPDNLHMNADGYALWTPIIKSALKSDK